MQNSFGLTTNTLTVGASLGPATVIFNSQANATTVVDWTNVTPTAGGQIGFNVIATNTGALNLLKVTQETSTNAPASLGSIAAGVISGNSLTLNWPAGADVHLQSTTNLTPPVVWSDVPSTTGQGSANIATTNTEIFFRLIQH